MEQFPTYDFSEIFVCPSNLEEYDENICDACSDNDKCGIYDMEYETIYGSCLAKLPHLFSPDIQCNSDEELLSWRHAIQAVQNGTFEEVEHYYRKIIKPEDKEYENHMKYFQAIGVDISEITEPIILHGNNTPWGYGISAFSEKAHLWDVSNEVILMAAESDISDEKFISIIHDRVKALEERFEKYKENQAKFSNEFIICDICHCEVKTTSNYCHICGTKINKQGEML